MQNFTSMDIF